MDSYLCSAARGCEPGLAQQPQVDITPYLGAFVPVSNLVDEEGTFLVNGTLVNASLEVKHNTSAALGARTTVWFPGGFGLEGAFGYMFSGEDAEIAASSQFGSELLTGGNDANVWALSARALYRFGPSAGNTSFHVGAGPAIVGRGGDAYEGVDGTTDLGGVVNFGAVFEISPQLGIRADLDDYIYSASLELDTVGESESQLQNDLTLSSGVVIHLGQ